ncbi:DUF58 domain-containing protein [Halomicrobium mukohataei]|uniref:DUF58 domain-containing protein n=1 Tax=Halomicrobium mukohataei TaxID=57705 RepID=A0A847U7X0_9EURY|nr:DUF58 domain-containing protein [Halomicrobium mukohataei]NLV08397.1 DUF58 domain-containing protein [Halomicrobium mukohataei]
MQVTRRYWTVAALGTALAVWGVVVAGPLALLGSGAVGAWLLARQYRFVRSATRVPAALSVDLSTRDRVTAEETAELTVAVRLDTAVSVPITVTVDPPVGATGDPATVSLAPGEREGVASTAVTWPVAGSFTVDDVSLSIADTDGLFAQLVELDAGQEVAVSPRAPDDLHVGEGGNPIATGFGEQASSQLGTGIEPAEIREYVPGDAVRQIDWKATARLDQPHVMEFEGGADRQTILVFDHRATMADGRAGTTKLDYARQLAVAIVDRARTDDDGIGYYAVGDDGVTTAISPLVRTDAWATVRAKLLAAATTEGRSGGVGPRGSPNTRVASRVASDDSAFGRTLAPFLSEGEAYQQRFDAQPLAGAIRTAEFPSDTVVRTVIVTDDSRPDELRAAVRRASRNGSTVAVFMTPTALFESGELTDLAGAYSDYVAFEEFRRELAGMEGVDAYEVGPGDRLSAVLSAGRTQRRRESA